MSSDRFPEEARNLVTSQRFGVLSTISVRESGFPFGSVTPYDIDPEGRLVIYISLIAEHYKNLSADARASVTVLDPFGAHDPQAHARATVLAVFEPVSEAELDGVRKAYERRFPGSINYDIAHNFLFMRGAPSRVRWIGGFGEIGWVPGEKFQSAAPDPLAYESFGIVAHMNDEHQTALVDLARAHSKRATEGFSATMTAVTSRGFSIRLRLPGGDMEVLEIPFRARAETPEAARAEMIRVVKAARGPLPN